MSLSRQVQELEQKCREALQYPSVHHYLLGKGMAFERICALLDFVGDSEVALSSVATPAKRTRVEPYFLACGLLQSMYARQYALRDVLKAVGISVPSGLTDKRLTEPRNRIIGHPITSAGASHVILRNTLSEDGFEYASYFATGTSRGNIVEYQPHLEAHWGVMKEGLELLYRALVKIENQRRSKMRKSPLSPELQGLGYVVQCLAASTVEERYGQMVQGHTKMLARGLQAVRNGLVERLGEEDAAYHLDALIEGTQMLNELDPFGDDKTQLRFRIVAEGIEHKTRELILMAAQLDEKEAGDLD